MLVSVERTEVAYEYCLYKLQFLRGNPTAEKNTISIPIHCRYCHPSVVAFGNHCYSSAVQKSWYFRSRLSRAWLTLILMGLHDMTNICLISIWHSRRDQIVFLRFPPCPDDGFVCSLMQSHDAWVQIKSVPSVLGFHSNDTHTEKSQAFISFKLEREQL